MSEEIERRLLLENEELRKRLNRLEGKNESGIPTYSFSKIKFNELKSLVELKQDFFHQEIFSEWFGFTYEFTEETTLFLEKLLKKNMPLINLYHEEDLKVNFIVPLINHIDFFFFEDEIRSFYNEKLTYKTEKFIFNGETDFMVADGLVDSSKPYFFIQEFKKGFENTNPEPQLLAELISALELNKQTMMKGAYIVGATWNFVILEKLGEDSYRYFISRDFNCTNRDDLGAIYKNLCFIKDEILKGKRCVQ